MLAIGVIGVTPEDARAATLLAGTAMLNAHEVTTQNTPTISSETIVASGISDFGVLVSSATVLTMSKPVKARMPNRTARLIADQPPVAAAGLNGLALKWPCRAWTTKMVMVSAMIVAISNSRKTSADRAVTVTLR
jgi:hypothetical protein